jgi:hypothetical protein
MRRITARTIMDNLNAFLRSHVSFGYTACGGPLNSLLDCASVLPNTRPEYGREPTDRLETFEVTLLRSPATNDNRTRFASFSPPPVVSRVTLHVNRDSCLGSTLVTGQTLEWMRWLSHIRQYLSPPTTNPPHPPLRPLGGMDILIHKALS